VGTLQPPATQFVPIAQSSSVVHVEMQIGIVGSHANG
jgi:hypothetical protein